MFRPSARRLAMICFAQEKSRAGEEERPPGRRSTELLVGRLIGRRRRACPACAARRACHLARIALMRACICCLAAAISAWSILPSWLVSTLSKRAVAARFGLGPGDDAVVIGVEPLHHARMMAVATAAVAVRTGLRRTIGVCAVIGARGAALLPFGAHGGVLRLDLVLGDLAVAIGVVAWRSAHRPRRSLRRG